MIPLKRVEEERMILIVEDDQLFRRALATYLVSRGFRTRVVATAEEALASTEWPKVDLVLIDYFLPGMNGIELAKTIRARHIDHPRLVLMSGYLPPTICDEAKAASIEVVLHKPYDMEILDEKIQNICEEGQSYGPAN
jgi:CheY-like chemotaxis protein